LKRWTLASVVSTDILQRAVPWSRLVMERSQLPNDLNLRWTQRIAAAAAPLALVGVGVAIYAIAMRSVATLGLALAIAAPSAALNWPMLRTFASLRGFRFALSAWLFHQIHLIYASATFAVCALWHRLRPPRKAQKGTSKVS
jgi:hypothetical protein